MLVCVNVVARLPLNPTAHEHDLAAGAVPHFSDGSRPMKKRQSGTRAEASASPATQLSAFLAKLEPDVARLVRAARGKLRKRMPTANELVYDNYNFFVI